MATSGADNAPSGSKSNNGVPLSGSGPRKTNFGFHSVKRELYQLSHPYYIVNLILGTSFIFLRLVPPVCYYVFGKSGGKYIMYYIWTCPVRWVSQGYNISGFLFRSLDLVYDRIIFV